MSDQQLCREIGQTLAAAGLPFRVANDYWHTLKNKGKSLEEILTICRSYQLSVWRA